MFLKIFKKTQFPKEDELETFLFFGDIVPFLSRLDLEKASLLVC